MKKGCELHQLEAKIGQKDSNPVKKPLNNTKPILTTGNNNYHNNNKSTQQQT